MWFLAVLVVGLPALAAAQMSSCPDGTGGTIGTILQNAPCVKTWGVPPEPQPAPVPPSARVMLTYASSTSMSHVVV